MTEPWVIDELAHAGPVSAEFDGRLYGAYTCVKRPE